MLSPEKYLFKDCSFVEDYEQVEIRLHPPKRIGFSFFSFTVFGICFCLLVHWSSRIVRYEVPELLHLDPHSDCSIDLSDLSATFVSQSPKTEFLDPVAARGRVRIVAVCTTCVFP